jgi:hypothetical protein
MRYITPYTNFGGVRCELFVGLVRLNDLLRTTVEQGIHDLPPKNVESALSPAAIDLRDRDSPARSTTSLRLCQTESSLSQVPQPLREEFVAVA